MAIIYSYPQATVKPSDRILASDTTQTGNPTINITVGGIANYILTLLGFGSGTPGTMPVWVTDQQLGNSYIRQITSGAGVGTTIHTVKAQFDNNVGVLGDLGVDGNLTVGGAVATVAEFTSNVTTNVRGDANFYARVNVGTVGTTNISPLQIYNTTQFYGDIRDTGGSIGTNTQVLSSLGAGAGVSWVDQLPSGLNFKGTWDAFNNIPVLASGVGVQGDYYIVSADGTTNLDGFNSWEIGDWCVFNGTVWQEIDNQNIFSGTGTTNTMTKWTGTSSLGDSQTTDNGTDIVMSAAGLLSLGGAAAVGIDIGNSQVSNIEFTNTGNININGTVGTVRFNNTDVSFSPGVAVIDATANPGAAGQVLSSTGTQVEWIDVSAGAGAISGSGTNNTIARWTPIGTQLGDSSITDDLLAVLINPTTKTTINSPTVEVLGTNNTIGVAGGTNLYDAATNDFQGDAKFNAKIIDTSGSAGTSGQVLSSTIAATSWVSPLSNTDGARQIMVNVDAAALATLSTTPKQLIPAPGVGKVIETLSVAFKYDFNTVVYDFTSYLAVCADGFVGSTDAVQAGLKETLINGAGDVLQGNQNGVNLAFGGHLLVENTALVLGTPGIDPTQGDGSLRVNVRYRILNVSDWTVDVT